MTGHFQKYWPLYLGLLVCVSGWVYRSMNTQTRDQTKDQSMEKKTQKIHRHKFRPIGEWSLQAQRKIDSKTVESVRLSDGLKSMEDNITFEFVWKRDTVCSCGQTSHEHRHSTNSVVLAYTVDPDVQAIHAPPQRSIPMTSEIAPRLTHMDPDFADDPSSWIDRTK
jgi:hypothetical protein